MKNPQESLAQCFKQTLSRFQHELDNHKLLALPELPGVAGALIAKAFVDLIPAAPLLIIAPGIRRYDELWSDLSVLHQPNAPHLLGFPPYSADESRGWRVRTARALKNLPQHEHPQSRLILTSIEALLQPVPDPSAIESAAQTLLVNHSYPLKQLITSLVDAGYERVSDVDSPGEMAVRGGIIDLWAPAETLPWRMEFFGDSIESLRSFDPATQRSIAPLEQLWIPPCVKTELPLIQLGDILPAQLTLLWIDHDQIHSEVTLQRENVKPWQQLQQQITQHPQWLQVFTGDPPPPATPVLPIAISAPPGIAEFCETHTTHPEILANARQRMLHNLQQRVGQDQHVMITANTPGACELLTREFAALPEIAILQLPLSGGFEIPGMVVITHADLYGTKQNLRPHTPPPSRGGRIESVAELQPGDLVVHIDHGIGRFQGTTELVSGNERTEVFTIQYADGAKLHVPVAHAHLLSRYIGVAGHRAKLHRLGSKRWVREKTTAEQAVADLAVTLLDTQAKRAITQGTAFDTAPPWMHEFEAAFQYEETPDQAQAIAEIKKDMANSLPMDRLICGDAGYGKTEVAMRGAFIAVMNGWQVAVLVPTTILAEQHHETFKERMAAYPIRIEVISRFYTPAKRRKILADAALGLVDIVIGTHALLSPGVSFQKLGLLVIDEEQRFGVSHKEKLKQMRQVVDVLTLSATPIPRTLYMSMTGARDMSLLQTPPRERVAVETRVVRDSDLVLRNAINRELDRAGQVFLLFNRVMTIELMRRRVAALVPQARLAVAHGQLPTNELATIMRDFEAGKLDILLCTTIIESGLDIPRANTIIIHRADRFGIADLYQLRGRVGRSARKGFAWLLLPEYGVVDAEARHRIAALQKHSGLGAGFNLALRDLELRGAGNLLGAAQSGHIAAIGFGLYCQLLRRTIAKLKGETLPTIVDVSLELDFINLSPGAIDTNANASLPYAYIEEEAHRMILHRRVAEAVTARELQQLGEEIADRYGKLPDAVKRLLRLAELRILAASQQISRVETKNNRIYLYPQHVRTPLLTPEMRLPRLTGKTVNARINSIFKALRALPGKK